MKIWLWMEVNQSVREKPLRTLPPLTATYKSQVGKENADGGLRCVSPSGWKEALQAT